MREFKDKIVVTKKEHACGWCERRFPAGTRMRYMAGLSPDGFQADYYCEKCDSELHAGTCYEKIEPGGWEMA